MLPEKPAPRLSDQQVVDLICRAARERRLLEGSQLKMNYRQYGFGPEDVRCMLAELRVEEMSAVREVSKNRPDCDVFAFVIEDEPDEWGPFYWYTHISVNYVTYQLVVVESLKYRDRPIARNR